MMKSCRKAVTSLLFFQFTANFEQSESRIPDDSNLLSYKTDLKYLNTALTLLLKVLFLAKSADFLQKNADTSKIKRAFVLKFIFSEIEHVCVLTCQI